MARRRLLAVVAALLGSVLVTSAAGAECAWVLWRESTSTLAREPKDKSGGSIAQVSWDVVQGASSSKSCEAIASLIKETDRPASSMRVRYACLPDTIDPRGPKGK